MWWREFRISPVRDIVDSLPRGLVGSYIGPSGTASASPGSGPATAGVLTVPLVAGRRYGIECQVLAAVANNPGLPGATLNGPGLPNNVVRPFWVFSTYPVGPLTGSAVWNFNSPGSQNATYTVTISNQTASSATTVAANNLQISVEDKGAIP